MLWFRFHWNLFPWMQLTIISQNWFRLCLDAYLVSRQYLNQLWLNLLMQICVTQPQWVNDMSFSSVYIASYYSFRFFISYHFFVYILYHWSFIIPQLSFYSPLQFLCFIFVVPSLVIGFYSSFGEIWVDFVFSSNVTNVMESYAVVVYILMKHNKTLKRRFCDLKAIEMFG